MWNPLLEVPFLELVDGIFASYLVELDEVCYKEDVPTEFIMFPWPPCHPFVVVFGASLQLCSRFCTFFPVHFLSCMSVSICGCSKNGHHLLQERHSSFLRGRRPIDFRGMGIAPCMRTFQNVSEPGGFEKSAECVDKAQSVNTSSIVLRFSLLRDRHAVPESHLQPSQLPEKS